MSIAVIGIRSQYSLSSCCVLSEDRILTYRCLVRLDDKSVTCSTKANTIHISYLRPQKLAKIGKHSNARRAQIGEHFHDIFITPLMINPKTNSSMQLTTNLMMTPEWLQLTSLVSIVSISNIKLMLHMRTIHGAWSAVKAKPCPNELWIICFIRSGDRMRLKV